MKGVIILGNREVAIEDFAIPEISPGWVLVRVKSAGICGSDMHIYRLPRKALEGRDKFIVGHEVSGRVEKVSECVKNVKEGDRIVVYHIMGCGYCAPCSMGYPMYCSNDVWTLGSNIHGGDAEYLLAKANACLPLPNKLSFEAGAIMGCAAGTAYQILRKLNVSARDVTVFYGLGPLGLSAVLFAKALGASVIGVDIIEERLRLAEKLGADKVIDGSQPNIIQRVKEATNGTGADVAIDFSGNTQARINAINSVSNLGKVGLVGVGPDEINVPQSIIGRGLTLTGTRIFPINIYYEMVQFIIRHNIYLEKIVTHRFPLLQAKDAFEIFDKGRTGKVILIP